MAPPVLFLKDIHLSFGGTPLLEGAEFSVAPGERLCLVGRNGSGKSTLLKIAAGLMEPDSGERFVQPGVTRRYLPQEPDVAGFATVEDFASAGLAPGDDHHRVTYLLESLGLDASRDPKTLSGGETRKAALVQVLAPEPDILFLDEPTNHLDLPTIEWLENEIQASRSAIVMISHDRRFLTNLSRGIVWIDRGQTKRLEQGFAAFEAWRDSVLEDEERDHHKLARQIVREEHWLRYGVSARRKRNQKRLADLHGLRKSYKDHRRPVGSVAMVVSEADMSGKKVVEATKIAKTYGETTIVKDLSLRILRGDRLAIVGPNGAGKTTLIGLLTGALAADSGSVSLGTNLEVVTLDQHREGLGLDISVAEALTGGRSDHVMVNGQPKHVIGYMKDFLFQPEQKNTPIEALSGGERGRLMLARALAKPSNMLVLDEPTNDLDLETLDLLQEMLADYPGTLILVSHDRDFIDRIATSVLMAEGDGKWVEYAGGYTDMVAQRGQGISAKAKEEARPKATQAEKPREAARKMSFKDKHALETLPKEMDALRIKLAAHAKALEDPQLYVKNRTKFDQLSAETAKWQSELAAAEDRWLELEMLRDELEH